MSTFAEVQKALVMWPGLVEAAVEGTAARLVSAIGQLRSAAQSVGPGDLAALSGQFLREEALNASDPKLTLRVPAGAPWPDPIAWQQHGVDVTLRTTCEMHLRARPWHPDWMTAADGESPITAALSRCDRRLDSRVVCDPVWTELLGHVHYLSPGQRAAVRASVLLKPGHSLLVVLPTGGGKSLLAQAPAFLEADEAATTLLVVPTVALALDQERRATELFEKRRGRRSRSGLSFAYHGGLDAKEKARLRERVATGGQPLLITSPEAVVRSLRRCLLSCASRGALRAIVLDEAHLVGQWGNEFRPDFQALAGVRRLLLRASPEGRAPRTVLLTATLTQDSWRTLRTLFGAPGLELVVATHLRPEPDYFVSAASDRAVRDARVLEAVRFAPRPLILYTSLREDADRWYDRLRGAGLRRIGRIHGATPAEERRRYLLAWSAGDIDVMVSTSAFGLGMDKADVRTVVHACVPETLDRYYQEVGRGGRDGRACLSILVYEPVDLKVALRLNTERIVGIEKGLQRWRRMYNSSKATEDGEGLLVWLDSRPSYIQRDTEANLAWNMRTLVLMARAGLIELDAAVPPPSEREALEPDEAWEQRQRREYERYVLSVAVRPTGEDHLDEETWKRCVGAARDEVLEADRRSFEQVRRLLAGQEFLADLLIEAYTLDANGVRTAPERVEGRCPVSRAAGRGTGCYLVPEPLACVDVPKTVGRRLAGIQLAQNRWLLVAVPGFDRASTERWREDLLPLIRRLVRQGIREIRAVNDWLALPEYRSLYRAATPRLIFHTELRRSGPGLSGSFLVPRLTVLEGDSYILDLLVEASGSQRPLEVLFVPEDLPDPARPDRLFLSVRDHIALSRFQTELD